MAETLTHTSRHGVRAKGQTTLTFSLPESLKSQIEELASKDGRTTANWLRLHLTNAARRSRAARRKAA